MSVSKAWLESAIRALEVRLLEVRFNLALNDNMYYPMVIGRPLIAKFGVVDSSRTFTIAAHCKSPSSSESCKVRAGLRSE